MFFNLVAEFVFLIPIAYLWGDSRTIKSTRIVNIVPILKNKKEFLELLLLADEQESMIDCYLERGEMFILSDNDTVKASCVITCEDKGIYEIKSIAVYPEYQRQGYGRQLIAFVLEHYKDRCHTMLVGTGDSPLTIPFYESCGFAYSHRVPDFFIDNYDHPIFCLLYTSPSPRD